MEGSGFKAVRGKLGGEQHPRRWEDIKKVKLFHQGKIHPEKKTESVGFFVFF